MYIIVIAVFIILILLFWDAIKIMIKTMSTGNLDNGYLWFFCLLSINVIIISFIIGFYYYKLNIIGEQGENGNKGYTGIEGDLCSINTPCISRDNNSNSNNNTDYENTD